MDSAGSLATQEALREYGEKIAELNAHLKDKGEALEHLKEVVKCALQFQT